MRVGAGEVVLASATSPSVEEGYAWLAPAETAVLARFRLSKRASDWRLGRWVAKEAVARALGVPDLPWDAIEIMAGPGGGPRVRILAPREWAAVSVSLSHAAGTGFAASVVGSVRLGCDVEEIAPRSDEFVADYFTADEAAWIRAGGEERHVRANLLWSAKESALKALGEGLRKDTRSVAVAIESADAPAGDGWQPLSVAAAADESFAGWWRVEGGFVWTVVARTAR
ncbi:MAG: 4'-phosphopantetheinyl transferase superfamily protein [Longimicrobiales bacterium]|nr:4'-phosphopantetheinyl transferase superfamily protein [Longimicrobiales bacterium]